MNKATVHSGLGFLDILLIAFVVLKLTGVIHWSWWWVLCPLWAPLAVFVIGFFIFLAVEMWRAN